VLHIYPDTGFVAIENSWDVAKRPQPQHPTKQHYSKRNGKLRAVRDNRGPESLQYSAGGLPLLDGVKGKRHQNNRRQPAQNKGRVAL
jgi:hypothetical protein